MAALAPIPARKLKRMLEADGYSVKHEDDANWVMDRGPDDEMLNIPKHGRVLALEVMDSLLSKAKINDRKYFDLLARVS
ncbi:MAG: hypothetical protein HYU41_25295 [Candidatus Rokubacteria bacterium]|nr:hypothetical protein [Candidatus Rokubacteria bacterium]